MKREELWTPSARRFECLLKAAQNGDYNAYMSLMARFFKVMDDKARNNYLRDYEMFTALVERVICGVLKNTPNVFYGGSIPYSQVENKTAECDIFVIAEGFRDEDINLTKYSLSTKASDGLASGAAVLTYGPDDAGVVGYMKGTGASMVCTDPKSLKESLRELIYNEELQENFYQKAVEITQAHHTIESSTATFEKVVERAIREFKSKRNNA